MLGRLSARWNNAIIWVKTLVDRICIDRFESSREDPDVSVSVHYRDNLDGKVSLVRVTWHSE
jgi:hypothetical protein